MSKRTKKPVILNLGANRRAQPGMVNVDLHPFPGIDVVCDLEKVWPWEDSTVDEIIAVDLVEHLHDRIHTMNEAWRVLKPGGTFEIIVPSTDGRGADQDPTHVSFWNENSFSYYGVTKINGVWVSHPWRLIYAPHSIKAAFEIVELVTTEPDPSGIVYCRALCRAVKEDIFDANGIPESALDPYGSIS